MRLLRIALALVCFAAPLAAQSDYMHTIARAGNIVLINRHPNCNPLTPAFDPMWFHNVGWTMPRIGWTVMDAALNLTIAYAATKFMNRKAAAITAPVPLEVGPHIGQMWSDLQHTGTYQMNLPDWIADPWNRSLPTWVLLSDSLTRRRALLIWLIGDAALFCFARP
jgi:hypothetical protein